MQKTEKIISLALSVLIISSILFLPATASETSDVQQERVFTTTMSGYTTLDGGFPSPLAFNTRGGGYVMTSNCFDTLVWPDQNGEFIGLLAESWESSKDGIEWTFNLRENVTWHDGEPFTAEDVVFTIDYMKDKSLATSIEASWYYTHLIESTEALDEHTVLITLNQPYAAFIPLVAGVIPIMPEHIWKDIPDPKKYTEKEAAIGTGPFILEDYDMDQKSYKFSANKDYFLGEPIIDTLIYIQTSDTLLSLKTGEIDESSLTFDQVQAIEESDNLKVISGPGYRVYRLRFNIPSNTILNDIDVRKAMSYSLDCEDIESRVLHGGGTPGNPGYVAPYSKWYNPNVMQYAYDPEKANQMLDEAGYQERDKDGIRLDAEGNRLEFQLLHSSDQQSQRLAELVQTYLEDIGIGIVLKSGDMQTVEGLVSEGNFDLAIHMHGTTNYPGRMLNPLPSITGWNNSEFVALAEEQIVTVDEEKRKELVNRMQVLIADEVPTIPIMYKDLFSACNQDTIDGFFYTPDGIAGGSFMECNKLVFIYGTWNGESTEAAEDISTNSADGIGILGSAAVLLCVFLLRRDKKL
ncbi:ABC transporter substrate-binding protein [Methanolobus vulcani]|uniref:Peptide ABC transporter substrate-binding protein n=1 Tax=Methanolobus vulcani TaxID=38026 RepID=A0A7Z8KQ78_9EURY|nr:ABC transporter substrate-binding protein [Methanolobus vulcani]TQD27643.1 peptide ABC transporter substrate-binding protein [Methanolobus vulcani]